MNPTEFFNNIKAMEEKANMRRAHEEDVATLTEKISSLEKENALMREEGLSSIQYYRMEADLEDAHQENAELRQMIVTLREEKDKLRNDLVAEHNKTVDEFKKSEKKLVAECCEMSNKVAELKELADAMRNAIVVLAGLVGK